MMARLWVLLFLVSVVAVVSQVTAEMTTQPAEMTTQPAETTTQSGGPDQPNLDNDDDKDDDEEEKRCKKYDKHHKDDDDDDEKKEDDDEDDDHHRRKCHKKKIARLLCLIGIIVAVIATIVGITICVVRYRKRRATQISESQSTLQRYPEKSQVYIVTDSGYNQPHPPSAPGWPVVSAEPLPGKE